MKRRDAVRLAWTVLAVSSVACGLFPDASDLVGEGSSRPDGGDDGEAGTLPDGAPIDAGCVANPPDPAFLSATHITVGNGFACAIRAAGDVVCWGQEYRGQFGAAPEAGVGDPNVDRSPKPVLVPGLANITALAAGDSHTCAIDRDAHVWCWGWNSQGQLGNGAVSPGRGGRSMNGKEVIDWDPSPALVQSKSGGLLERVVSISSGLNHSCAIVQGGVVACWGNNYFGQLGEPGGRDASANQDLIEVQAVPSWIARGGAVSVAAGNGCSCAAIDGNPANVLCAGSNASNQLSAPYQVDAGPPVALSLPPNAAKPSQVVASFYLSSHLAVLDAEGNVFGSGDNSGGALGAFSSTLPAAVPGLSSANVKGVATGPTHTCAILADGTLQCIGRNRSGELGRAFRSNLENNPDYVAGPSSGPDTDAGDGSRLGNVVEVSVGYSQSCAIVKNDCRDDGRVYCWGFNIIGQLGDGTFTSRPRPVPVVAP